MTDTDQYGLNPASPNIMWIDLNSAFAKIEQQAHPSLRNRPVGITNRVSPQCCIITSSYEARARGVKTGMRRADALILCPELILLESDPSKYYSVYQKLVAIMKSYSPVSEMHSIDEGLIDLNHTAYAGDKARLVQLGREIKRRVKNEIGDYITINVGLGPNHFLAKLAAGLHKPDGLDVIDSTNLADVYSNLALTDLTGIASRYAHRLILAGINTPLQFLTASEFTLRNKVFGGLDGSYWYQRLRGYEIDANPTRMGMIGRQWVVDHPTADDGYLAPCLHHLVEAVGFSLRRQNKSARGVCVWLGYQTGDYFHKKQLVDQPMALDVELWRQAQRLLSQRESFKNVRVMGFYVYHLHDSSINQLTIDPGLNRLPDLADAVDTLNNRYGLTTVTSAEALVGASKIKRKIPFGSTRFFDMLR